MWEDGDKRAVARHTHNSGCPKRGRMFSHPIGSPEGVQRGFFAWVKWGQNHGARIAIALLLALAAVAKLSSPPASITSAGYLIAGMELLATASLLFNRHVRLGLLIAAMIAIVGSLQAIAFRQPCNCFGPHIKLQWKTHLVLCCVVGVLVAISGRDTLIAPSNHKE